ncbi:hypothetical protein Tco_0579506 [Tanacetum coccineum]
MSTFNLNEPIYSAFFIIHSESASRNDASAVSTAKADPEKSAPSDFVPQQQDQTKSISEGLETVLTQPRIGKGASSNARQVEEEEAFNTIKLEDLAKLVSNVQPSFKDLDLPKDDPVIIVDDSDKDEENEVHTTTNAETEDTSSQKHKLELEKNKAEAALLKAQPTFPNVGQLNELLVKSLQTEFSKILFAHDFSNSLPTELKDLPSKFNELTEVVKGLKKQVHELEIELPGDLKEIPTKLEDFTAEFLSLPVQVLDSVSSKAGDQSVPSAGQADTMAAEGEKNTNQATISQLFQRRAEKNAKKENLNNQQPKLIPSIITTTTQMQSSSLQSLPKSSSQPEGKHIKKDKGKKAMSSEEAEKNSNNSDSNDDDETYVTGSMVEPSTIKKLKKFNFITKDGRHIHLTKEEINHQKKLEEDAKAEANKQE